MAFGGCFIVLSVQILDTIEIQIEACEELRPVVTAQTSHLTLPTAGKYGFVNKVVDGITVTVEAVEIRFFSKAFESKVQVHELMNSILFHKNLVHI